MTAVPDVQPAGAVLSPAPSFGPAPAWNLAWLTPQESIRDDIRGEMSSGHDRLVRMALAHVGLLH